MLLGDFFATWIHEYIYILYIYIFIYIYMYIMYIYIYMYMMCIYIYVYIYIHGLSMDDLWMIYRLSVCMDCMFVVGDFYRFFSGINSARASGSEAFRAKKKWDFGRRSRTSRTDKKSRFNGGLMGFNGI